MTTHRRPTGTQLAPIARTGMQVNPAAGAVLALVQAVNPLGVIAEAYARTLAYRLESRRIDVELRCMHELARLNHARIDNSYRLAMAKLCHQRQLIDRTFALVEQELGDLRIEREGLRRIAYLFSLKALGDGISSVDRKHLLDAVTETNAIIRECGAQSIIVLAMLVRGTTGHKRATKALPAGRKQGRR